MKILPLAAAPLLALLFVACSKAPETPPAATATRAGPVAAVAGGPSTAQHAEHAIAWEAGDVDAAFVRAKAENKPLFLYWGAVWCPPCNEVKATIFTRQDFIERSRNFVPVYIDGDAQGRAKAGRALQRQRLSDDGAVHARTATRSRACRARSSPIATCRCSRSA